MDDDASGEVLDAPLGEHPSTPDHVNEGYVDEKQPGDKEDQISLKFDPIGKGPCDKGGSDDGKHHLISYENVKWDIIVRRGGRVRTDTLQEGLIEVSIDAANVAAETKGISYGEPDDIDNGHGHEALYHNGQNILSADQPTIEKGQSRRHQHYQTRRYQHKSGISSIEGQ
jgi:hypothetical protein